MLVLPGPAFVVIPVGLAILSLEFKWAERLLEKALVQAHRAQVKAARTTPAQRVLSALGVALAAAAFVAAADPLGHPGPAGLISARGPRACASRRRAPAR